MERQKNINTNTDHSTLFLYIIFGVGIIGHMTGPLRKIMSDLTPFTLLITGSLVLYKSLNKDNRKLLLWAVATYAFTFALEAVGVATGELFGNYKYGPVLGISILNVPLIIGFNWVLVIMGSIRTASLISKNIYISSLLAGLLAVMFDFVLEPVAVKLDYWNWENSLIPFQNYAAWFIIAFLSAFLFIKIKAEIKSDISKHYFFIQFAFFIILSIFLR